MRYLRTKDGIYKIRSLLGYTGYIVEKSNGWRTDLLEIEGNDIIKQADTIEELIDEFVVREFHYTEWFPIKIEAHNSYDFYQDFEEALTHRNRLAKCMGRNLYGLYGFIWVTDSNGVPTLKPVARLNEEGGLELL